MYLWKVDSLVEDLKAGRVTQREQFKYYLVLMILWTVVAYAPYADAEAIVSRATGYLFLEFAASMATTVAGMWVCYKRNSAGDGVDFVPRMVCLAVPVITRIAVFFFAAFFVIGLVIELVAEEFDDTAIDKFSLLVAIIAAVIAWVYQAIKIRNVSAR